MAISRSSFFKIVVVIMGVCLFVIVAFFRAGVIVPTVTYGCDYSADASLTPAAGYFADTIQVQTDRVLGGHPIEGYEPSMLMQAYPKIQPTDFACVQASGGRYDVREGRVIFVPTGDPSMRTSAEQAITSTGMGTLLENIAKRLQLPLATQADVEKILQTIASPAIPDQPERMTLEGEYVCLQPKDIQGPQTLECAFGLKTDDGSYYAFDTGLMFSLPPPLKIGDRIRGNGIFVPIEHLSTDHWQKYNMKGIFSVTSGLEKRGSK